VKNETELTVQTCRDCEDLGLAVMAVRFVGKTPVCDEHFRQRMRQPNSAHNANSGKTRGANG
jgi:hypothetical protein